MFHNKVFIALGTNIGNWKNNVTEWYDYENQTRRQDRMPDYVENGAIYLFKPEILERNNRFGGNIGIYMMEFWQSFEIDEPDDWKFIELLDPKNTDFSALNNILSVFISVYDPIISAIIQVIVIKEIILYFFL